FRCLFWHSWDGCVCRRCNPEARLKVWGWRNRGHDLDGCYCRRCRQFPHDWDGCVCRRCEASSGQGHEPWAGRCAKCGATITGEREIVCGMWGGSGTVWIQGGTPQGDPCTACGGSGRRLEHVWSPPADPCVRPRRRPAPDARLAAVMRDTSV